MAMAQSFSWCIRGFVVCSIVACFGVAARADDVSKEVKKAVEQSTLDQPGTKPFHLKARFVPSLDRAGGQNRIGEIEIWWQSPQQWRREIKSPQFHQIEIVNSGKTWEKNDSDYFPEWLRELAQAMVKPVPLPMDDLLRRAKSANVRHLMGQTNLDWDAVSGPGDEQVNGKGYLALRDDSGVLLYTGGPGWSGSFHDFQDFHGRKVAMAVASGSTEVTAKVSVLEDLGATTEDFFNTSAPGGEALPIETVALSESALRTNLSTPAVPVQWPALADGPLEGVVWTEVAIDRSGHIREMIPPISDNAGVKDAAEQAFRAMQFKPVMRAGVPVQVIARLSMPFKTVRPAGMENFASAKSYFEQGRKATYLAYGQSTPYVLRAEFQVGTSNGVQTGRYEDTWLSPTHWKREAWVGASHVARSREGEKYYRLSDGPDAGVLQLVLTTFEPIPASDTMTESDWRIRRDSLDGVKAIRVIRGPEGPDGKPGPEAQALWFGEDGRLLKSSGRGLDTIPGDERPYGGMNVAHTIYVAKDGKVGMRVTVKEIAAPPPDAEKTIKLKGHEWQRAFTAEER